MRAYIHKDGWIVTYYLKIEPTSKIFHPFSVTTDNKIGDTRLDITIKTILNTIGSPNITPNYYHFAFPNANKLLIVLEVNRVSESTDEFKIYLPDSLSYFQYSYYHYRPGSVYYWVRSIFRIENTDLSHLTGDVDKNSYAIISPTLIQFNRYMNFSISNENFITSLCAVIFVYTEF